MKLRYFTEAVQTEYWMPNSDYLTIIASALRDKVKDGDIIVISEKALAVAKGLIVNEGHVKPGLLAKILAYFWMKIIWGFFLGAICRLKKENIQRLRNYPKKEGSIHKQVALLYVNFLQALLWGSEGGIDGSNLPFAYVSLPLSNPQAVAEEIRLYLMSGLGKKVTVMIVDTDKTYSFRNFHFTHRPAPIKEIHSFLGVIAYIFGRALKLKRRATPLAISGARLDIESALNLAEAAHRARGSGAGRTVWDMAERFGVDLTGVTWDMLKSLRHKPIVIIRLRGASDSKPHRQRNHSLRRREA
ncbi:coenzyme F420-0:L-glutamate ligase [Candidatus Bathyarchaeota archaeon]|nr:coenzyme F420-0:L-glutamate ligase [Candidatus Bathyarchaeota archaeon]